MTTDRKRWLTLIGLAILSFVAYLDFTIVTTALPTIQKALHASVIQLQWVVNIFAIVLCLSMVLIGKLGDIFGRRKIFYIGVFIFIICAFGTGFSQNIQTLIFFRGIQGLGAAIVFVIGFALIPHIFPDKKQAHAIGVFTAITGAGLGIGPFLSGVLISLFNWHWVFFINAPIIVIGFLMCGFLLTETKKQPNAKIDWTGFLLFAIAVASLMLGLTHGAEYGWDQAFSWSALIIFLFSLISLLIVENRVDHPLLDLSIFTHKKLLLATIMCLMAGIASFELFFFDPLYLASIRHLSAFWIGLALFTVPGTQVIISSFWGKMASKIAIEKIIVIAILCGVIATLLHLCFGLHTHYWIVILGFVCIGIVWAAGNTGGIGLALQASNPEKSGSIVGSLGTFWNLMGALSVTLGTVIFHHVEQAKMKASLVAHHIKLTANQHHMIQALMAEPEKVKALSSNFSHHQKDIILALFKRAFLDGFHGAVWLGFGLLSIGFIVSLRLVLKKDH